MSNTVTLTNASVSSGTVRRLLATKITYSWNNLTGTNPWPGGFSISPIVFQGWKNPGFNIQFYLQQSVYDINNITHQELMLFAKSTTQTYLQIISGENNSIFRSYATDNSGVISIPIQIIDISFNIDPSDNTKSDMILVSMNCIETR